MVKVNERALADHPLALAQWANRSIRLPGVQVKVRLRENKLHILCEGRECPDRETAIAQLLQSLESTPLARLFGDTPLPHQLFIYGRIAGQKRPEWTEPIDLSRFSSHSQAALPSEPEKVNALPGVAAQKRDSRDSSEGKNPDTLLLRARSGDTRSIASYLGKTLRSLGVKVKAIARPLPQKEETEIGQEGESIAEQFPTGVQKSDANSSNNQKERRLWVFCEAAYKPDPSLLAEPVTQKLRELHLEGFRDAVILCQVTGEATPEWMLRVDLTPPEEMLREWASWGDGEAIAYLLNQTLTREGINVSAVLKESTLHLSCVPANPSDYLQPIPDQGYCIEAIAPILEDFAPRSIYAATIYGHESPSAPPAWVSWQDLPALREPELAKSAFTLAQQRDEAAIAFLLGRFLNPDLDWRLATGGIRVQVRFKDDLLHVMTDAPVCPSQRAIAAPTEQFVRDLDIHRIAGIRIYGRRAGQKQPLWRHSVDWGKRSPSGGEAAPEFPQTENFTDDLTVEEPNTPDVPSVTSPPAQKTWRQGVENIFAAIARFLVGSQLYVPAEDNNVTGVPSKISYKRVKLALVWGTLGILLTTSVDLVLGQILRLPANQTRPSAVSRAILRAQNLGQAGEPATNEGEAENRPRRGMRRRSPVKPSEVFNTAGFTTPGNTQLNVDETGQNATIGSEDLPFPSFNNPQLDAKLALYQQRVAEQGAPDVLIIGSSRALRGVDPEQLQKSLAAQGYKDVEIFNFGINGATAKVVDLMVRQILTVEQLPKLIIWADGARAFNGGRADNTYRAIAGSAGYKLLSAGTLPRPDSSGGSNSNLESSSKNPARANNVVVGSTKQLNSWLERSLGEISSTYPVRDRLQTWLQERIASKPEPDGLPGQFLDEAGEDLGDWNGFSAVSIRFQPEIYYEKHNKVAGEFDGDYKNFQLGGDQAIALESLIEFTQAREIPLVFINLPLTAEYLDPVRLKYEREFEIAMLRLSLNGDFIFRDWSQIWPDKNEHFSDPSHLNRFGAAAVSQKLAQDPLIPWPKKQKPGTANSDR